MSEKNIKVVCQNKKAYHDYFIEDAFEAGIVLVGTEVKSLRLGHVNLKDSYATLKGVEVFLVNTHISPYKQADRFSQPEPDRTRKLLLHRHEINKLIGKVKEKGYTLIPTKIYFKNGKAKVEIALAKGKKFFDKREAIKKKTVEREMEKAVKDRR
ncbi:MAG: SsrA-binding protein [Deltaproteobacteria bacterium GWC2_42_51]|nr:MAG: SsrA-binding protein [Deltaproteobacteria bacterium GWB2_42_7]OGP37028.1 MAG: SsrA-binding protein [Deltaproteobacteria bacterium GWC2_42_51]OGP39063.1 MAG: SsrA-binding protein [Deltaproteobacteria bacterium GWD2_42_10]OGP47317.1 MAG: SsrA-binding protein [Deltaproteobacteria bacterium GWF2_42_12]OGQ24243.1 MAG: SsrA-binding protein [Deltaproteobacteria bacterium RIFCSPHIGHO2_02_FULL_42_44]OGQ36280.1 MAG: SsrA-binding protein [Deltaproteobacteria bacterium RIFCSPLOWO2_02_FULL_42_39]O